MAKITQRSLFSWKEIACYSDLNRLRLVLDVIPDGKLMRHLEMQRGNGRNDYPIRPCWNAVVAGIVFKHTSAVSLLRELSRNGELRGVCGFDPFQGAKAVPSQDAFGRFLVLLMNSEELVSEIMNRVIRELGQVLPDLGKDLAVDSKAIKSFGNKPAKSVVDTNDRRRDTDAAWGVKEYSGVREDGTTWNKVTKWFGYKLHLVVDSNYELPLGFSISPASHSDTKNLMPLVGALDALHAEIAGRTETLSADRGYDSANNNRELWDKYRIRPIIDIRQMWKDSDETRPVVTGSCDSFVYNSKGEISCICPATGKLRLAAFAGFETGEIHTSIAVLLPLTI